VVSILVFMEIKLEQLKALQEKLEAIKVSILVFMEIKLEPVFLF